MTVGHMKIGLAEKNFEYPKGSLVICDEPILKRNVSSTLQKTASIRSRCSTREFAAALFPDKDLMTNRNGRRALILLTYLPAFFAAGVACVVAALLVLTIGKRSTAATVAR